MQSDTPLCYEPEALLANRHTLWCHWNCSLPKSHLSGFMCVMPSMFDFKRLVDSLHVSTDGNGWRSERLQLLKGISATHTIPGTESTRLRRQTRVSHAVDWKPNNPEIKKNTWVFTHKPLIKGANASARYRHQRFIYTEFCSPFSGLWVTNCRSMTSHSLHGIRNEQSSWCKARRHMNVQSKWKWF